MTTAEIKELLRPTRGRGRLLPDAQRRRASDAPRLLRDHRVRALAALQRKAENQRRADPGKRGAAASRLWASSRCRSASIPTGRKCMMRSPRVPGSLKRTLAAIRLLRSQGLRVTMANVLMRRNRGDSEGVHALAGELGAHYTLDPTITPMMDGNTSVLPPPRGCKRTVELSSTIPIWWATWKTSALRRPPWTTKSSKACLAARDTPPATSRPTGTSIPACSFHLTCGNVRRQKFLEIWRNSPQLAEVRSIRAEGSDHVLFLHARRQLHTLPGACLHGREYARAFVGRLREILCADGNCYRGNDGERSAIRGRVRPRPDRAVNRPRPDRPEDLAKRDRLVRRLDRETTPSQGACASNPTRASNPIPSNRSDDGSGVETAGPEIRSSVNSHLPASPAKLM